MVEKARRRLSRFSPGRIRVSVGDAEAIDAPAEAFDAVFDFGILHHVPDWKRAVGEIRRVLRPGGRFFFEEVTSRALARWSYRTLLEHPREGRFTDVEFVAELERREIEVGTNFVTRFFGDFVFGVGRRRDTRRERSE